jgi:uncharacterized Ntn-hydrolase superfamily protein
MTWSIVARDPHTGHLGVAISTCHFAVGAICPNLRWGVGALSSQSYSSPLAGARLLDGLAQGLSAEAAISAALDDDEGRTWRQIHGVDAQGNGFSYTGSNCVEWCGSWQDKGVSVAGNMLAGAAVVAKTAAIWMANERLPFAARLLTALDAGQAAGGDKRGKQSAALIVIGGEAHAEIDLRVDDHPDPIIELRRLFDVYNAQRLPGLATMPSRANPSGVTDPAARQAVIDAFHKDSANRGK